MAKVTIRNEFTGAVITVDPSKPVTAKKVRSWRSKLHAADCTSGDDLGGRGKQADPEAYEDFLVRAQKVVLTGRDESDLMDYDTAEAIRPATVEERAESTEAAKHDGGAGVIDVDGRRCYVAD